MRPQVLILDFDGTMTDAEAEAIPFRQGYLQDIAALTGLPSHQVEVLTARFEEEIANSPETHGWTYEGRVVSPAMVDPYVRLTSVAHKIFDEVRVFPSETDRSRLLQVLFRYNYPKTMTVFRPGAMEVLAALYSETTYIMTNSHPDSVHTKIGELTDSHCDNVHIWLWAVDHIVGDAKKYVIDPNFGTIPESTMIPGLNRPVLLRRRHYYEALEQILRAHDANWEDLVVVGDVFELDLALPLALGARVGLAVNNHTPIYEQEFLAAHPRGCLILNLDEVIAFAGETT